MRYLLYAAVVAGVVALLPACRSESADADLLPPEPTIEARTITASELPAEFDESRTYYYRSANLQDPEGMIVTLWHAGFHATRAWQPLDSSTPPCFDPLGATFTVELEVDDAAIVDKGFTRGVGRLFCAATLTEFTVSGAGG